MPRLRRVAAAAVCLPVLSGCALATSSATPTVKPTAPLTTVQPTTAQPPAEPTTTATPVRPRPATKHARRTPQPKARPAPHKQARPTQRHHRRVATGPAATAAALLATLPVKGRAPMTSYDRDEFGQAWLDANRNGCDTRNDILARDLHRLVYEPGTYGCVVVSGVLSDPYTAQRIYFVKGDGNLVDIDHVVALGNAWATGAFGWPVKKRAALANDPMNLLAVDASANRQKGDGDAATWLPSHKSYRCAYVARQVTVKAKYQLWVTPAERAAMARVLDSCPGRAPVRDSGAPVIAPVNVSVPHHSASTGSTSSTSSTRPRTVVGGSTYYQNCDAARAAGAAPVHRGDPGYAAHLDRDGDGVGCE